MSPLSGYQMWKAGQAKARHKVKNWAARILTKQARKVQNNLIERWRIYRGDQVMVVAGKDKHNVFMRGIGIELEVLDPPEHKLSTCSFVSGALMSPALSTLLLSSHLGKQSF